MFDKQKYRSLAAALPRHPQRQDSTNTQLRDLLKFSVKLGLLSASERISASLARCLSNDPEMHQPLPERLRDTFLALPKLEAAGGSPEQEMLELRSFAARLGLYDADDFLRSSLA